MGCLLRTLSVRSDHSEVFQRWDPFSRALGAIELCAANPVTVVLCCAALRCALQVVDVFILLFQLAAIMGWIGKGLHH